MTSTASAPAMQTQIKSERFSQIHGIYPLQRYVRDFGASVVNCFDVEAWKQATSLARVGIRLVVRKGSVRLKIRQIQADGRALDLGDLVQSGPGVAVLPGLNLNALDGAILPLVQDESADADYEIIFGTDDEPVTPNLRLNYVFFTFKRAQYVQQNAKVFRDYLKKHRSTAEAHLTIVDNGHDGSEDGGPGACGVVEDEFITVLANNNTGGSGGFGRGLYETCYGSLARERFTHVCFLDDDIQLHPEMFARNTAFMRYVKPGYHVGAPMYPISEVCKTPRTSVCFGHKYRSSVQPSDTALGVGLDTADVSAFLKMDREPDSTGWWWSCFAVRDVHRIGLPYPFFIKMDDVEYSLRLQDAGVKLVIPFSFWVLHEDFETKYSAAMQYFRHRNRWLLLALRGQIRDLEHFIVGFDQEVRKFVAARKYEHAQLLLDGMQDFLRGPENLITREQEILSAVFALVKREKNGPMQDQPAGTMLANDLAPPTTARRARMAERTWNNHFVPLKERITLDTTYPVRPTDSRRAKQVSYWNSEKRVGYTVQRNSMRALRQMLTLRRLRKRILREFPVLLPRFQKSKQHLTSPLFWSDYGKHGSKPRLSPMVSDRSLVDVQHSVARLLAEPQAVALNGCEGVTGADHAFFNSMRNRYKGRRCFILGNGPSLQVSDLEQLKNEITFAANKIYLCFDETDWRPTFYSVEDLLVAQNCRSEILAIDRTTKIFAHHMLPYLPRQANHHYARWLPPMDNKSPFREFSTDLTKGICWGSTITYSMLQMAVHMGFEEIYILGLDHSYVEPSTKDGGALISEGEINHFHPEYRKPGERWHYPVLDRLEISYQFAKDYCDAIGVKVYNASRYSELTVFPRVDLDQVLQASPDSQ